MQAKRFLSLVIFLALLVIACQSNNQTTTTANPTNTTSPSPTTTNTPIASSTVPSNSATTDSSGPLLKVGITIPEVKAIDVASGATTTIASHADKTGQLVIVYAPSCPVCHATLPRIVSLYNGFFQQRNIPVIALSVQPKAATEFSIKELNLPFKVAVMPDVDKQFGYHIPNIPTTIALGPDGSVKGMWVGQLGPEQLSAIIKVFCPDCQVEVNPTS